jgi:flavorubredoxin
MNINMEKIISVTKDVKWIGIRDFDLKTFDIVMETKFGTTYNSYFIDAEKKTIIDTAKEVFKDEYLEKIKSVTNPAEIEYIVFNHTEPDHSGSLKHLLQIAPNATVVGSGQAINYLNEIANVPFKSLKVKDGDVIDLGNKKLHVIGAPNLHWPDSIYTYLEEDKLLFTCDSFGAHYCSEKIFDDEVGDYSEAFKYYFDVILKPFSKFMLKAIEKIRPLQIETICTGHGPILRSNWKKIVDLSEQYSREYLAETNGCENSILIAYVSAYGCTRQMADEIANGILSVDSTIQVNIIDLEHMLLGDIEESIVKSRALIVGSPTINQNTLLPVYKLFAVVNPIRDRGKLAAAFGSYGWSGEGVKIIEENLKVLKLNIAVDGLAVKFYPGQDKSSKFIQFGQQFAEEFNKPVA